ncbi:replication protein P [Pseudomonas sp. TMP25]|uniref:replication protein P n=1 Tax=Pseudomonas sp. TMP25 TaxID=3136561 RepID=UPI00310119EF
MNNPKPVAALVANLNPENMPSLQVAQPVKVDANTKQVINDLFDRLKGLYPAWKQAWPTDVELRAAKLEWLAEFMRAGIRQLEQIQHGVRMAAKDRSAFAPSPGVFVSWCFAPEAFGLPDAERAYKQALRNTHPSQTGHCTWAHPAVYHASVAAGWYSLQRLDQSLGFKRFEQKYLEQCQKLGRGEVLSPSPVAALPEHAGPRTPEVGRAALAMLRKTVAGGK